MTEDNLQIIEEEVNRFFNRLDMPAPSGHSYQYIREFLKLVQNNVPKLIKEIRLQR